MWNPDAGSHTKVPDLSVAWAVHAALRPYRGGGGVDLQLIVPPGVTPAGCLKQTCLDNTVSCLALGPRQDSFLCIYMARMWFVHVYRLGCSQGDYRKAASATYSPLTSTVWSRSLICAAAATRDRISMRSTGCTTQRFCAWRSTRLMVCFTPPVNTRARCHHLLWPG
jgi:hypothetical protein